MATAIDAWQDIECADIPESLTCEGWLPILLPHLSDALASTEAVERVRGLSRFLPGGVQGALEFRLTPGPSPVDLSVRVGGPNQARRLAGALELPEHQKFLNSWAEARDPRIPFLWVEVDLDRPVGGKLRPVYILRVSGDAVSDADALCGELIPHAFGRSLGEAQERRFRECLAAAPEQGAMVYVFDLACRGTGAVRMDFYGLQPPAMRRFMESVGRPDLAAAIQIPERLEQVSSRFHFNFDVDGEGVIQPRMGIECSVPNFPKPDSAWGELLESVVEAGWCTPEKRDALFQWPGYSTRAKAGDLWPRGEEGGEGPSGFMIRNFSHVKIVVHPEKETEAKAYLTFGRFLRNQEKRLQLCVD